ncbi:MAG TPA: filamentous hemagglutinin N-terminal domain-containing protein [Chthoniobacteraceae bacterium]|jgi:filamentous hemagglutinin family protein|nr:filamentous hemagglutinin N-terminal domain-containing protein [Chthoniobacteraceae bacterium]
MLNRRAVDLALIALLLAAAAARGAVATDGSLPGTAARTLSGPAYVIPQQLGGDRLGVKVGGNLFHSFRTLDLAEGESATFTELSGVQNVIARITGGKSTINGRLSADANLYLVNPQGFLFSEKATLDVTGSFTATTANSLKLGTDGRFATALGEQSVLTSSPVSAYGFTNPPAGFTGPPPGIAVKGSTLAVPQGKALQLVGGEVTLEQARLTAPGGPIALASAAGAGEFNADFKRPGRMGSVTLDNSIVDASGARGGAIVIRGGDLTLKTSVVQSNTSGPGRGGRVDVQIDGDAALGFRSQVFTKTTGAGAAGDIEVHALSLALSVDSLVGSQAAPGSLATAGGGLVRVRARSLSISDGSAISASTFGLGKGGEVDVAAGRLDIRGEDNVTGIFSNADSTGSGGRGGNVRVQAGSLTLRNGGQIAADTKGRGRGGDVTVIAGEASLNSTGATSKTGIFADTLSPTNGGAGGNLMVQAGTLRIANGALISTRTLGLAPGGSATIRADTLTISRDGSRLYTGIAADSPLKGPRGPAGEVLVEAGRLRLLQGGQISSNTFGLGRGGNVKVTADDILMTGQGSAFSSISADTFSTGAGGPGGNVQVQAGTIRLENGARISANTFGSGAGGDVVVRADEAVFRRTATGLFTGVSAESVSSTEPGRGGSVLVEIGRLSLFDGGGIFANTRGPGAGGDISVRSDDLLLTGSSRISAETFGLGAGGSIRLAAGSLTVLAGLEPLFPAGVYTGSRATGAGGPGGTLEIEAGVLNLRDGGMLAATSTSSGAGGSVRIAAGQATLRNVAAIEASATGAGLAGSVALSVERPLSLESASAIRTTSALSSAGTVEIVSASDIILRDSSLSARAVAGDAGTVTLRTTHLLLLDHSTILAEAGLNGGNVSIDPRFVILDHSRISANAVLGAGGNILLVADTFLPTESAVTASSEASVQGTISIQSPEADLAGSLAPLTGGLIDATSQLREQCARRLGMDFSSLLLLGNGGVSAAPGGPMFTP